MKNIFAILYLGLFCVSADAQMRKNRNTFFNQSNSRGNPFLHKQWWIGIKGGINYSDARVEKSFAIITPTNYAAESIKKRYKRFYPTGAHVALEATFFYRGFSMSIQPGYQNIGFQYENLYTWTDPEQSSLTVDLAYEQHHRIEYITVPLLIKYELPINRFSPYVQAGFYTNILVNANKGITISGNDQSAGGPNNFKSEPVVVGATDLFARNHYGIIGGLGTFYTIGNIRLCLDVQYRFGLSLINSPENRYNNDRLAGVGDAMDDLTLNNLSVSLGTLFPLRFLSSGFKSNQNF